MPCQWKSVLPFSADKNPVNLFVVAFLENAITGLDSNRKDTILPTAELMLQVAILLSDIAQGGLEYVYESCSKNAYRVDKLQLAQCSSEVEL